MWTHARNATNNTSEGDVGSISNEESNYLCAVTGETLNSQNTYIVGAISLFADNTTGQISAQDLINTGQDQFLNWKCNVGIDRLCINPNGDIYGSTCYITEPYGNVNDISSVVLPTSPISCTRKHCSCGADVSIPKWKTDV